MTSASSGFLRSLTDGQIAWIVIENEARLNAFTRDMWAAVPSIIAAADADPAVRVIIVRGAGSKAFSAGADISEFGSNRTGKAARAYDEINHAAYEAVLGARKPTIAMVHGYCFGGACELAICCDLRVAAEGASFSVPAARLSLGYNPRWIKPMLAVMSAAKVKEMLFTARRYAATEALTMGLVNAVVPAASLETETMRLAREIADNAPLTLRAAKASVDAFATSPEGASLAELDRMVLACFDSDDFKEGARAFLEKRKPVFRGF
ncbi:MAG: enoyl-CoA hydratase [Hyphomicrobiaceae bacterium]|nr:enoyl-CoA hydratase [Hyphomicrobiaceae bacterium]